MHAIIDWIVQTVGALGYFGIFAMMFLESSFFPFPSEVVMIPAGYLSSKGEMNLFLAIACGIVGSIAGALFNYYIAVKLGRRLLLKYGHYVFFTKETLDKVETFFKAHGSFSTLSGRLIPVIRQYISLPAGLARMHLGLFSFYTGVGAGIWVSILALLGYYFGENQSLLEENLHTITLWVIGFVILIAGIYIGLQQKKKRKR
ncbi:DedA family protein [Sulfurospirillum deleyianum]|uniref:SNARE associated Golgi protein-related protein n=1 Tax=Sulfurospirillum deleyianum (strain ATCC 51133 / DSM 6946 / 5175) TaxID=525898 RepID=D1B2L4_SULD5|nr:DedA family protein [Sulfurospirillum deleyianum]ACZ12334.1 SNARE associated Golgi protein-related protein [Sulfurospirillum deleyianum DSM 6946]